MYYVSSIMYHGMTKQEKVKEIIRRLRAVYPHPKIALHYSTPLELLIATILSAQATDKVVNTVTPKLFGTFKSAKDYADADISSINNLITKVNFHNNKAKSIKNCTMMIVDKFGGKVPDRMEDLLTLPGVARKSANVVLSNAFNKVEGIVVDTHVIRLSQKLGLTQQKDPVKIERDLMGIVPKEDWIDFSNMLILAGREFYPARLKDYSPGPLGGLFTS